MGGGKSCIVCKHTRARDPGVHMHRFPANPDKRQEWCEALCLQEKDLRSNTRVCSRHFPNGDISNLPSLSVGKRFASPKKRPVSIRVPVRPKQGKKRVKKSLFERPSPSHSTLPDSAATTSTLGDSEYDSSLPSTSNVDMERDTERREDLEITVNAALMAHIEVLEQENANLKRAVEASGKKPFRLEDIAHDDRLVRCYTGFPSYIVLLAFFDFLGPAVNHLEYWGSKKRLKQSSKETRSIQLPVLNSN